MTAASLILNQLAVFTSLELCLALLFALRSYISILVAFTESALVSRIISLAGAYALPPQHLKFLRLLSEELALLPEYFLSLEAEDAQGNPKYTQYGEETCQQLDIGVVQIDV